MTADPVSPASVVSRLKQIPSRYLWGAFAVAVACLPVLRALSTTRIFCLRDLSFYFWPEHLWIRNALMSGDFPLWDPFVGFGQVALADPVRHMLYPPMMLLRLVPSAALGFNLAVALPFPVAAAGLYLFLRRRVSDRAAALGAAVFAVSGPMLSTSNMLNFSWSVATIPWALLAVDMLVERPTTRRFAFAAMTYAMFLLACEGTTLIGGAVLTAAYGFFRASKGTRIRAGARIVASGLCGIALAGVMFLPFLATTANSPRAEGIDPRVPAFWSLHPLNLAQAVSIDILGDPIGETGDRGWINDLNGYPEPFIYSIFFGITVLALAALGCGSAIRRWERWFWIVVGGVTLLIAFGRFVPVYGAMRTILPIVDALRFPVKFVVLTALAISVLAAFGWETVETRDEPTDTDRSPGSTRIVLWGLGAVSALCLMALTVLALGLGTPVVLGFAEWMRVRDPFVAADFLEWSLQSAIPHILVISASCAAALWMATRLPSVRKYGMAILFATAIVDPLASGWDLFPMAHVENLGEPPWAQKVRDRDERLYVGGRLQFVIDRVPDADNVLFAAGLPLSTNSKIESIACISRYMATFPSAWRVRDSFSFDNAMLWPREYWQARNRFRSASHEERLRFLRRAGVGSYLVPWTELTGASVVHEDALFEPVALWQFDTSSPRVLVTTDWSVDADTASAVGRSFEDRSTVLVSSEASPAGLTGSATADGARILEEGHSRLLIEASSSTDDGFLVVRDSFAGGWTVFVDDQPAEIVRADGLFRAVRIAAGTHQVDFRYEPPGLRAGLVLTTLSALVLGSLVFLRRRSER